MMVKLKERIKQIVGSATRKIKLIAAYAGCVLHQLSTWMPGHYCDAWCGGCKHFDNIKKYETCLNETD